MRERPRRWGRSVVLAFAVACALPAAAAGEGGAGFAGFDRSLNTQAHGYAVVTDAPALAGERAERFEVRPGDCARTPGWDDCATDRERSELSERAPFTAVGQEIWVGFWLYLAADFPNVFPAKTALGQFHQKNTRSPPVMFQHAPEGYVLTLNQTRRGQHVLIPEADLRGRWHKIVVRAIFSRGEEGRLEAWVNDVARVATAGPNTDRDDPIYFKYGVYRSFLARYKAARGVAEVPAQTAYFARLRKGATRAELERP